MAVKRFAYGALGIVGCLVTVIVVYNQDTRTLASSGTTVHLPHAMSGAAVEEEPADQAGPTPTARARAGTEDVRGVRVPTAAPTSRGATDTATCVDTPNYRSTYAPNGCGDYSTKGYCKDGLVGPNWNGALPPTAITECCACGKKGGTAPAADRGATNRGPPRAEHTHVSSPLVLNAPAQKEAARILPGGTLPAANPGATRVRCIGTPPFHSCLYENVYLYKGTFFAIGEVATFAKIDPPRTTTGADHPYCVPFKPMVRAQPPKGDVVRFNRTHVLGSNVHSNPGHNMLDVAFPFFAALLRFGLEKDNVTYVTQGKPSAVQMFGNWMRVFACENNGLTCLSELNKQCKSEWCVFSKLVTGFGGMGLTYTDQQNVPGGMRAGRAIWHFRNRIYKRFGVEEDPTKVSRTATTQVLFIGNKRQLGNLTAYARYITDKIPGVTARVVHWNKVGFVKQLGQCATADVHISGVGTAMMNQFLLREGAVNIQLGQPVPFMKSRVAYFDSQISLGLDYVRTLYYPSYEGDEMRPLVFDEKVTGFFEIDLRKEKLLKLVLQAIKLREDGIKVPVSVADNSNIYDEAYAELVERFPKVHGLRVGELGPSSITDQTCSKKKPEDILYWTGNAHRAIEPAGKKKTKFGGWQGWRERWDPKCAVHSGMCNETQARLLSCIDLKTKIY